MHQSHGGFLRRCRLAGGFLHQFPRPDKATLKQQKLQLENFGFSVFPHILVCFLRDVSVRGASPQMHRVFLHLLFLSVMFLETISFPRPDQATFKQHKLQLENFGFSVFLHILVCFLRDVSVRGASPHRCIGCFCFFL